ncbi:hypothetical protein P886_0438 [Alteromonadaceae bacterium 2753L.S.0a.02]|nr:hypothetical protein P886_0438 [Alteromonadaceae bacterium 2753L.S.0a.02]
MATQHVSLKDLLQTINDLFAEEVGPVAELLSEESLRFWIAKAKKANKKPSLRNIHVYLTHLSQAIEDPQDRQRFISKVYDLDALTVYRPHKSTS